MANPTPWRRGVMPHDNIQQGKVKQPWSALRTRPWWPEG